jgi:hypothetical protein
MQPSRVRIHHSSRISTISYVCLSNNQYLVELVLKATYVVGIPMLSNARTCSRPDNLVGIDDSYFHFCTSAQVTCTPQTPSPTPSKNHVELLTRQEHLAQRKNRRSFCLSLRKHFRGKLHYYLCVLCAKVLTWVLIEYVLGVQLAAIPDFGAVDTHELFRSSNGKSSSQRIPSPSEHRSS